MEKIKIKKGRRRIGQAAIKNTMCEVGDTNESSWKVRGEAIMQRGRWTLTFSVLSYYGDNNHLIHIFSRFSF